MPSKQREKSYKKWQCPQCGDKFSNPIAVPQVICGRVLRHSSRRTVNMKPVIE